MVYKKILITGGAGFVGSNLAIQFKRNNPDADIIVLDNLKRRGSELNLPRLKEEAITFIHGDVRNKSDFNEIEQVDLIIECSAEPSVVAGLNGNTDYLIDTNLIGLINCLNFARTTKAAIIFLSTSRVYPYEVLNKCKFVETEDRYDYSNKQTFEGVSSRGINETFTLNGAKSLYGATKLASELFIKEYMESFGIKAVINRFGCIAGPWQMGKVDQGIMALWIIGHVLNKELKYIGFGGLGKQVRDFIHIDDVFDVIKNEADLMGKLSGKIFNVGGGLKNSISLKQLTVLCEQITGNKIHVGHESIDRKADLKNYISDNSLIEKTLNWKPRKNVEDIIEDTFKWVNANQKLLKNTLH